MIPTYPETQWSPSLGKNPPFLEDDQVESKALKLQLKIHSTRGCQTI